MPLRRKTLQTDAELFLEGLDATLVRCEAEADGQLWRRAGEFKGVSVQPRGSSSYDWLLCGLGMAADILKAAGPAKTLREVVDTIIQALPNLKGARTSLWTITWTNLLDLDCLTAAKMLREVETFVRTGWDWKRDAEAEELTPARKKQRRKTTDPAARKARTPRPFHFGGKVYHFGYRQSLLLECLKDNQHRDDWDHEDKSIVSVQTVLGHVWSWFLGSSGRRPSMEKMENCLHQLQRDTNLAMKNRDLLLQIVRPFPNYLKLIQLPHRKT
jgi:hypothetical protein